MLYSNIVLCIQRNLIWDFKREPQPDNSFTHDSVNNAASYFWPRFYNLVIIIVIIIKIITVIKKRKLEIHKMILQILGLLRTMKMLMVVTAIPMMKVILNPLVVIEKRRWENLLRRCAKFRWWRRLVWRRLMGLFVAVTVFANAYFI